MVLVGAIDVLVETVGASVEAVDVLVGTTGALEETTGALVVATGALVITTELLVGKTGVLEVVTGVLVIATGELEVTTSALVVITGAAVLALDSMLTKGSVVVEFTKRYVEKNLMFNYDISYILYNYGLHWRSHKVISTELARSISLFCV